MPNFKPTIKPIGESKFYTNGQTFATEAEARQSAKNRYCNWMMAEAFGVEESDEPVNYAWVDGQGDVHL